MTVLRYQAKMYNDLSCYRDVTLELNDECITIREDSKSTSSNAPKIIYYRDIYDWASKHDQKVKHDNHITDGINTQLGDFITVPVYNNSFIFTLTPDVMADFINNLECKISINVNSSFQVEQPTF